MKSAVVTGGCGFIGTHCVMRLLEEGYRVLCIDNLSRAPARANLHWLTSLESSGAGRLTVATGDITRPAELEAIVKDYSKRCGPPEVVFHQAAQVAVTVSLAMPRHDFDVNAAGTLNVLEVVRAICPEAAIIFSSTNKVYGRLENVRVGELDSRYTFSDLPQGIPVHWPLDLHSPYGCSKGAADQYVRDYARIYNLRTLVFRQSCIYGTRQFGQEDQGWVSWFTIASALGRKVTIYGNGKQLRDLLWIDDLLDAYWAAWRSGAQGEIFNVGGGPANTLSLLELIQMLNNLAPKGIVTDYSGWRPGDQPVYVSDISDLKQRFNWMPTVSPQQGVETLWRWVSRNRDDIDNLAPALKANGTLAGSRIGPRPPD